MMGQYEEVSFSLKQKLEIIKNIAASTESEGRFVKAHKMKGLRRVLDEREELIRRLAGVNEKLSSNPFWHKVPDLVRLNQELQTELNLVIVRMKEVMEEARAERIKIAEELRNSRAGRQVRSQYLNPWAGFFARGRYINSRG